MGRGFRGASSKESGGALQAYPAAFIAVPWTLNDFPVFGGL